MGQWGRDVLDGSALGEELSEALGEAVSQAGLKFLLIRQTGRGGARAARRAGCIRQPDPPGALRALHPGRGEALLVQREHPRTAPRPTPGHPEELIQVTGAELTDSPCYSRVAPTQA